MKIPNKILKHINHFQKIGLLQTVFSNKIIGFEDALRVMWADPAYTSENSRQLKILYTEIENRFLRKESLQIEQYLINPEKVSLEGYFYEKAKSKIKPEYLRYYLDMKNNIGEEELFKDKLAFSIPDITVIFEEIKALSFGFPSGWQVGKNQLANILETKKDKNFYEFYDDINNQLDANGYYLTDNKEKLDLHRKEKPKLNREYGFVEIGFSPNDALLLKEEFLSIYKTNSNPVKSYVVPNKEINKSLFELDINDYERSLLEKKYNITSKKEDVLNSHKKKNTKSKLTKPNNIYLSKDDENTFRR